jgi:hypothetical protein
MRTALSDWLRRAPWLLALTATLTTAWPALAQNNRVSPKPDAPSTPFQEKSFAPVPKGHGVVTPQSRTDELEGWAKEREAKQARPIERETQYRILQPRDRAEFEALGRYALLLLTVVTQSADELPLKRVYLRFPEREIPLLKLASWPRKVDQPLVTYKMYGPYREDSLYLFPLSAYFRTAQVQLDLAANRSGLPVFEMPYPHGPDWLKALQNPEPLASALPNVTALQNLMKAKTSGFPIPTSLPTPVPEARRPASELSPQPDAARKPAALKDLFKK